MVGMIVLVVAVTVVITDAICIVARWLTNVVVDWMF